MLCAEEQVMSDKTFRPWEPDQQTLFPPSTRDFVPEGHLAHTVAAVGHLRSVLRTARPAALPPRLDDQPSALRIQPWRMAKPLSVTKTHRGAGLWPDQGGQGLPAIPASRPQERGRGMGADLYGPQSAEVCSSVPGRRDIGGSRGIPPCRGSKSLCKAHGCSVLHPARPNPPPAAKRLQNLGLAQE